MNRKDLDRLHKLMLDWGQHLRDGRSFPGLFPQSWPETTLKPKQVTVCRVGGRRRDKKLVPLPIPLSTRQKPCSRSPAGSIDPVFSRIDSVIIPDTENHPTVCVLYLMALPFRDATQVLDMTNKQLSKRKYRVLETVKPFVI